jgi:hypothetical protein
LADVPVNFCGLASDYRIFWRSKRDLKTTVTLGAQITGKSVFNLFHCNWEHAEGNGFSLLNHRKE